MKPLVVVLLLAAVRMQGAMEGLNLAEQQYQRTEYRAALTTLLSVSVKNAAVYGLIGKAYYGDGDYRNAIAYLERAVTMDPGSSDIYDWLGKAYGRRAETSSFITALPYAKKAREAFETSVTLNPSNLEALSDLFSYYLEAPGMLGGGMDKAEALATRIGRLDEAEAHYCRALIAKKRHDMRTAEQELRTAMHLAPRQPGRIIDLARFLAKQGRYEESDQFFRQAADVAPNSPRVVFERAAAYIKSGRNLETATTLLRRYADLPISPDDPPVTEAARLLAEASHQGRR